MFVVVLRYKVPMPQIQQALPGHVEWLKQCYADGIFLLSGPQEPHTGGVILARGLSRAALEGRLADDPFNKQGLADYEVIELLGKLSSPQMSFLIDA